MCIGGRLGLDLALPGTNPLRACFGETTGCLLIEVRETDAEAFESYFNGLQCRHIGAVSPDALLRISCAQQTLIDLSIHSLLAAWRPELD